jgi:energy-coupling factor transport system ATP-binding protein
MELVGLDYEALKDRSPFELSGGQKRRVAIAGVVAMKPKVLILDEPTAGLDPSGRDEILDEIKDLYLKEGITIILVSHSMEDVARLANRIFVMHRGKVIINDTTREVFKRATELEEIGLGVPQITSFMRRFKSKGHEVRDDILTVEEAKEEILRYLRRNKNA